MSGDNEQATPNEEAKPVETPDWVPGDARELISKANNQAARFRTEKNQAVEAHTQALNQVQELTDKNAAAERERDELKSQLVKLNVALAAGVPGERAAEFAARLVGNNEEELKADAEKALALFGNSKNTTSTRASDPSQGRGNPATPATPQQEFAQLMSGLSIFQK